MKSFFLPLLLTFLLDDGEARVAYNDRDDASNPIGAPEVKSLRLDLVPTTDSDPIRQLATTCTLCQPGERPFDLWSTLLVGTQRVSCRTAYDMGDLTAKVGASKCADYAKLGTSICLCQKGAPPQINTCQLCENGASLPDPNRTLYGNTTCAAVEDEMRRNFERNCGAYQGAFGPYCGCSNPISTSKVCHLCNATSLLPEPKRVVNDTTCIQQEFTASLDRTCLATKKSFGSACCSPKTPPPPPCFSGEMITTTIGGFKVPVKNLKVGDYVKDGKESYSRVYSFGHYDDTVKAQYLQIYSTHDGRSLEPLVISAEHMVFTTANQAMPAGALKVGDSLLLESGSMVSIINIKTVYRRGAYAPFTYSGKLVINGVVSSSYIAMDHGVPVSQQWLAHLFQAPHRICSRWGGCAESYTDDGLSSYVSRLYKGAKWWMKQPNTVKVVVFVPVFLVFAVIAAIEGIFVNPWTATIFTASVVWLICGVKATLKG